MNIGSLYRLFAGCCPVSDFLIETKGNQTLKENTREKRGNFLPFSNI